MEWTRAPGAEHCISPDELLIETRARVSTDAVLTLDRSPANLEYWMKSVLDITAPSAQGKIRADLMKIVNEQRGSSIAQFFTIQTMELDTKNLRSTVTGDLHTIVGNKVVSSERRSFRFDWQYSGLSLKLVGFGMVTTGKEKDQ